jgi:2-keto-4-pentenoate hydratase/2-oxohepta-3-ene-1,7-dioic acid hydratase in catechol pathway
MPSLPQRLATDMVAAIGHVGAGHGIAAPSGAGRPLDPAQLLAPIATPPSNVMCVGKNYHAHAHEFTRSGFDAGATQADAVPAHPIVFTKPASAISGPFDDIPLWPGIADAVDYEAELVIVIGKPGRFIPHSEALQHVFGYTIMNDVTARDLQRIHKQWFLGKAIDGFGPTGPWIVTADEIDPARLRVTSRVNGEIRQDANTADLIFDVPTLIATISRSVTLRPGDMIATGTPEGVGIGFDPPRFLAEDDVVEIEIEGIGRIRNTVRKAAADQGTRRQAEAAE